MNRSIRPPAKIETRRVVARYSPAARARAAPQTAAKAGLKLDRPEAHGVSMAAFLGALFFGLLVRRAAVVRGEGLPRAGRKRFLQPRSGEPPPLFLPRARVIRVAVHG